MLSTNDTLQSDQYSVSVCPNVPRVKCQVSRYQISKLLKMISRYFFVTPVNFANVARQAVLTDHLLQWSEGKRSVCGRRWDRVVIPEEVPQEGFSVESTFPETEEPAQTYIPGAGVPPVGDYQIPGAGGRGDVNHRVLAAKPKKKRIEKGVTGNELLRSPIKKTYEGETFKRRRFSYNPKVPQKEDY